MIAHASIDENNRSKNGKAGNQNGKEVCIRTWYNKAWGYVIRFKDPSMANKVADCMVWAAENNNIGYDQNQRNTLLTKSRKYNYNVSKVNEPCETDCSALVSVACMYAGIPESALTLQGNCAHTRNLRQMLKATGKVDIYSSPQYTASTDRLKRGDILLKEGSHVVVVVKVDKQLKSVDEVAKEIIQGKGGWGNGNERKAKLLAAGYDYSQVQAKVNELLKAKPISDTTKYIWDFLMDKIKNPYGVAGLMGNLKAESNLNPKNLQNTYEKKLGLTDETYTVAVDNGIYKKFTSDLAGYGLAQWTSSGRKKALYEYRGNKSIGDLTMQLNFLWYELSHSYKTVLNVLKTAKSVSEASDVVLTKYERPRDQSDAVKQKRTSFGKEIYAKYVV